MRRPWKYASFWCARIISGAKAKGYGEDVGDDGSELVMIEKRAYVYTHFNDYIMSLIDLVTPY